MPDVSKEVVDALNRHAFVTAKALEALMARTQLREAMRSAVDWRVASLGLPGSASVAYQLVTRNPGRKEIVIKNQTPSATATAGALIGPLQFDVVEAQKQYAEFKANISTMNVYYLGPQQTVTIKSSGPIFVAPATVTHAIRVEGIEYLYRVDSNTIPVGAQYHNKQEHFLGGIDLNSIAKELA